jgi:hypothetical protein
VTLECMKSPKAYRMVLIAVVLWVAASPFIWRRNLVAAFGDIPWSQFSIPLSLAVIAVLAATPLWNLNWRCGAVVALVSVALAVLALLGSGMATGGLLFNAVLVASVAAVPVAMHSNNAFKRRRAKTHAHAP